MSAKQNSKTNSSFTLLLRKLKQVPKGGLKMLDLAAALSNRGHHEEAAHAESTALDLNEPEVIHRWRRMQARRAPANQFLLLQNELRSNAFRKALSESIRPGDLVLEIGTGSGILAMMAARAGADPVISCEHQILMAEVARDIIRNNGLDQKVRIIAKESGALEVGLDLPRQADVLIADLFTGSLLEAGGLRLMQQAQKRLTKDGCRVVPAKATLRGRLVGGLELEELCSIRESDGFTLEPFNLFSPPVVAILPERFRSLSYSAYSDPIDCFDFDLQRLCDLGHRDQDMNVECIQSGEVLGFLQWLHLEVSPGNILESSETSSLSWPRFLHVFPQPLSVQAGQLLKLHLEHDWISFSVWPL